MNTTQWIEHFRSNRTNRPEPEWNLPILMNPRLVAAILPSIEQFQLGDGGGPGCLIAWNAHRFLGASDEIHQLANLWFQEEREHSRLLGCAVRRFGGRQITSHWSFTAFCGCRRIGGIAVELQILLLTEIVSTAYYRLLRRHAADNPLKAMCSLILRDEAAHVRFHRDRLNGFGQRTEVRPGPLWLMQFWVSGHAAATMLWLNHGRCLKALGATRREYFREVRLEIYRFVRRLNGRWPASNEPRVKLPTIRATVQG